MNFRRGISSDEPELNLVPLIDLMLVILIFLMATTTYSKLAQLQIQLPAAEADKVQTKATVVEVAVTSNGAYYINQQRVNFTGAENLAADLSKAAKGATEPVIEISADGNTSHQTVVNVMSAAQIAGFNHLTFTTQPPQ